MKDLVALAVGILIGLALAVATMSWIGVARADGSTPQCMPMSDWLATAVQYKAEPVDKRSIGTKGATIEYWASANGENSAIVIINAEHDIACLMASLVMEKTGADQNSGPSI